MFAVFLLTAGVFSFLFIQKLMSAPFIKQESLVIDYDYRDSSGVTPSAGKTVFQAKCQSCHNIYKDLTGPALLAFRNSPFWSDNEKLYKFLTQRGAFKRERHIDSLRKIYGRSGHVDQIAFPGLTRADYNALIAYFDEHDNY